MEQLAPSKNKELLLSLLGMLKGFIDVTFDHKESGGLAITSNAMFVKMETTIVALGKHIKRHCTEVVYDDKEQLERDIDRHFHFLISDIIASGLTAASPIPPTQS